MNSYNVATRRLNDTVGANFYQNGPPTQGLFVGCRCWTHLGNKCIHNTSNLSKAKGQRLDFGYCQCSLSMLWWEDTLWTTSNQPTTSFLSGILSSQNADWKETSGGSNSPKIDDKQVPNILSILYSYWNEQLSQPPSCVQKEGHTTIWGHIMGTIYTSTSQVSASWVNLDKIISSSKLLGFCRALQQTMLTPGDMLGALPSPMPVWLGDFTDSIVKPSLAHVPGKERIPNVLGLKGPNLTKTWTSKLST